MSKGYAEAEGFVLAGGRSSRMGQDKALLRLGGRSMLEIALDKLRALHLPAPPRVAGLRSDAVAVADLHPGCGPLSGIEAALIASSRPLNVFLPVDMPLLPPKFLVWMLCRAQITGAAVTLPRINGRPQPLCAVYHRELLAPITASLLAGDYKVMGVVCAAAPRSEAVDIFDVELVSSADPDMRAFSPLPAYRWFHNCNTPEDIAGVENALVLSQ
jgi:molybdopterin-guanine dinucleotide biosynthesis protein A